MPPALADVVQLGLRFGLLLSAAAASRASKSASALSSAAAGSGCTATAVSPSIVSGRVVAIVTCSRLARLGVDHRVAEVPEMAGHGLVEDLVVADRRLQIVSQLTSRLPR